MRDWLEQLEAARPAEEELLAVLAYAAGQHVDLDPDDLAGALRRAVLVHASGGGLHRELRLDARAGEVLAADLDDAAHRAELCRALAGLKDEAARLPFVREALTRLLADTGLAWRVFAVSLLAEELGGA